MPSRRSLIDLWVMDAEAEAPDDTAAQIEWLQGQRAVYSEKVKAGDWAATNTSDPGGSASYERGVSDMDQHEAIVGALRRLGATEAGAEGALLHGKFGGILN